MREGRKGKESEGEGEEEGEGTYIRWGSMLS